MECIKDFLSYEYQSRLRLFAQEKSEKHEDAIISYRDIFIAHFLLLRKKLKKCENCINRTVCEKIRDVCMQINESEIIMFIDKLREIYLEWIDSDIVNAIKLFDELLKKYDLLKYERVLREQDLFFKARKSDEILTKWDMFHIPFNKRYLIGNQRYSITGQPMLYIGSSIIDIAQEINQENLDGLKISMIRFKEKCKIYDLKSKSSGEIMLDIFLGRECYSKSDFFKVILCSVCSFQKRQELRGYSFCEEYVIPQILALILKREKFDGISYLSTKKMENVIYDVESEKEFKENIAIFTKNNENHVYDKDLYEKIIISVPIDKNKLDEITIDDLNEINSEIALSKNKIKIVSSEMLVSSYKRIYGCIEIKEKGNIVNKYSETEFGKIHIYELYTVLNEILVGKEKSNE